MKQILLTNSQVTDLLALIDDVAASHASLAYADWAALRKAVASATPATPWTIGDEALAADPDLTDDSPPERVRIVGILTSNGSSIRVMNDRGSSWVVGSSELAPVLDS